MAASSAANNHLHENIDPSHVRNQQGSYGAAFSQLEERFQDNIDKVHKWREALTKAANLSGFDNSNKTRTEADLVDNVVKNILTKLDETFSDDLKRLVGIESRINDIKRLLCNDYAELLGMVVDYAEGMPLALKILGSSFLHCKSKEDWEAELNKLKKGSNIDFVKRMSDSRGLFAAMSLIKISSRNCLEMHDFLQEMGRSVVHEQCIEEPGKCKRLSIADDAVNTENS
ncbi:disease resistance protein RPV1-like [Malus sylvestris]|uniref:disease resistance protein RPV1-like n=1 Tax=Malus sylvestris TaxID=3752 RepID=UPI0021AC75C9|nr:disease resistance protein RPV1-like [Malus sylvestris]